MINNVTIVGRLTKDVELRYTGSGIAVGSFTLAVERPFKNADGEKETDFINGVIWRKNAENMANFTTKGSRVGITGRIQTRNYQNNEGQTIYVTEVVAENFHSIDTRAETDAQRNQNGSQSGASDAYNSRFGGNNQKTNSDPFAKNEGDVDIPDSSLPF